VTKRLALAALVGLTTAALAAGQASITIRFFDRRIYYAGDPVQVEAVILNNTSQAYRFKMADKSVWSFDFEVHTPTLDRLAHASQFTMDRSSNQPVFFREISLEPGEQYGLVLDLGSFVGLDDPGVFTVRALFYPELARGEQTGAISSNALALSLRPQAETTEELSRVETETGLLVRREALPPDEVVSYAISARQKSQWDRFLLYLDLESLLRQSPDRDRRYQRSSEEERLRQVEQYRQDLMRENVDPDILLRPSSFEVERTSYTRDEAQVSVRSSFVFPDYTEWKRYTYRLQRSEGVWVIVAYDVRNLGTE
jgi:hypothetical protein